MPKISKKNGKTRQILVIKLTVRCVPVIKYGLGDTRL